MTEIEKNEQNIDDCINLILELIETYNFNHAERLGIIEILRIAFTEDFIKDQDTDE